MYSKCTLNVLWEHHTLFRMLMENPDLLQLYRDLVTSQVITAEEFWADHAVVCFNRSVLYYHSHFLCLQNLCVLSYPSKGKAQPKGVILRRLEFQEHFL